MGEAFAKEDVYPSAVQDNTLSPALDTQQSPVLTAAVAKQASARELTTLNCQYMAVDCLWDLNGSVADPPGSDCSTGILTSVDAGSIQGKVPLDEGGLD